MEAPFAGSLGHHEPDYKDQLGVTSQRDTTIQIVLSAVLGIGAFLGFCFLRPRWKSLYQARKRQRNEASPLPDLPDSFFGWIPGLWKITEQQVLASAGLDAYVFLRFFKLACKFLSITLFFSLVIFKPVHDAFPEPSSSKHRNGTDNSTAAISWHEPFAFDADLETNKDKSVYDKIATDYLWMYLVFVYVLSGIVIYLLVTETERIIAIRQQFLGSLHTVTDRTIRLSGIPVNLRSEEKIKDYIEDLGIGKVDSVTLCRRWEQLDDCVQQRMNVLRKLEEAWTVFLSQRRVERNSESLPISQPPPPGPRRYRDEVDDDDENNDGEGNGDELLLSEQVNGQEVSASSDQKRPKATLRYGFLKLRYRKVDAIDYYEDVLAGLDERIRRLREQEFEPTPLAFVTMDSVAACVSVAARSRSQIVLLTLISAANGRPSRHRSFAHAIDRKGQPCSSRCALAKHLHAAMAAHESSMDYHDYHQLPHYILVSCLGPASDSSQSRIDSPCLATTRQCIEITPVRSVPCRDSATDACLLTSLRTRALPV